MNNDEKLMQLDNLYHEWEKIEMNWYRHLLTLSAGALVLMATVGPTTSVMQPLARYFLSATWVLLG